MLFKHSLKMYNKKEKRGRRKNECHAAAAAHLVTGCRKRRRRRRRRRDEPKEIEIELLHTTSLAHVATSVRECVCDTRRAEVIYLDGSEESSAAGAAGRREIEKERENST